MNKKYFLLFVLIFDLLLCTTISFSEETLYVQPFRAKVFAMSSISSKVVGSVDSGFQFVSTGKEGNWVKLVFKGKQGFIPVMQTAKTPPLGKSTVRSTENTPKLSVRTRASSSSPSVVAGMKGLSYEDRARISKGEQSDFESLEKVDALKISPDELKLFQLEGGKQ